MEETLWYEWIDARLDERGIARTGPIEQPHVQPWSTVLRVPTATGQLWAKSSQGYEAAVTALLAARRPDVVPPPLAVDPAQGWMLMTDGGETLRVVNARERSLDRWLDVLDRYARLQLTTAGDVESLLASGVPDRRAATLPAAYAELLDTIDAEPRFRAAVAEVADLCGVLDASGIPDLIQHDDLHDAQVFVRAGQHLVLDWGDACVSHPFLTMAVTLEGVVAWGLDDVENSVDVTPFRDAYLKPYAEGFSGDLTATCVAAVRLGWVCRAINGHVPGDDGPTRTRLRMFLDGRP